MLINNRWVLLLCLIGLATTARAQEINASVHVDRSQINNTSLDYLDNLADQIQSYLNDYTWTKNDFQPKEKINVAFQITLLSASNDNTFTASIVVRSLRPIYDTDK